MTKSLTRTAVELAYEIEEERATRRMESSETRLTRLSARTRDILRNRRFAKRMGFTRLHVVDEAKIPSTDVSDPTGNVVVAQENVRKAAQRGEEMLALGVKALEKADAAFTLALMLVDNRRPLDRENWNENPDPTSGRKPDRTVSTKDRYRSQSKARERERSDADFA